MIDKHGYTLFNEQGRALVEQNGWTALVFCGIDTEICVLKSAVDAFEAGITPWILTDASASHSSRAAHDAGIFIGRRFIGPAVHHCRGRHRAAWSRVTSRCDRASN